MNENDCLILAYIGLKSRGTKFKVCVSERNAVQLWAETCVTTQKINVEGVLQTEACD